MPCGRFGGGGGCPFCPSPLGSGTSNIPISGCELKDKYYISFVLLFKASFYSYLGISVIFQVLTRVFLSLVRVTHVTQAEVDFLCSQSL